MSRKLLFVVIVVLALAAVVMAWLVLTSNPSPATDATSNLLIVNVNSPSITGGQGLGTGNAPKPQLSDPAVVAKGLAITFAERYGTYSSDADWQNLRDLRSLLTEQFRTKLDSVVGASLPTPPGTYYGVTTHAIMAEVKQVTDATATVDVTTQRQELFSRTGEAQLSYQTLRVMLERVGSSWLVDSAEWEKP